MWSQWVSGQPRFSRTPRQSALVGPRRRLSDPGRDGTSRIPAISGNLCRWRRHVGPMVSTTVCCSRSSVPSLHAIASGSSSGSAKSLISPPVRFVSERVAKTPTRTSFIRFTTTSMRATPRFTSLRRRINEHSLSISWRRALISALAIEGAPNPSTTRDGSPDAAAPWNRDGQRLVITYLIEEGADPDAKDNSGVAPLHRAVRTRSSHGVRALIESGADPRRMNKADRPHCTSLSRTRARAIPAQTQPRTSSARSSPCYWNTAPVGLTSMGTVRPLPPRHAAIGSVNCLTPPSGAVRDAPHRRTPYTSLVPKTVRNCTKLVLCYRLPAWQP